MKSPFVIYADFESILVSEDNGKQNHYFYSQSKTFFLYKIAIIYLLSPFFVLFFHLYKSSFVLLVCMIRKSLIQTNIKIILVQLWL